MPTQYLSLCTSVAEIYRRAQWNFFRVEREHIANYKSFKAVLDVKLPFDYIDFSDIPSSMKASPMQSELSISEKGEH